MEDIKKIKLAQCKVLTDIGIEGIYSITINGTEYIDKDYNDKLEKKIS